MIQWAFVSLAAGGNLIQRVTERQCPPAASPACCLVQLALPPASLLHLALFSLQWNSSFPQTCTSPRAKKKKPGQVICGEWLKIHSRAKTTVFMDPCCDKQPSPSDCMTNAVFLPFQSTCRLALGAAAPWHLSNVLVDINVALSFIPLFFFRWPLLRVRVSLIEGHKVQLWV